MISRALAGLLLVLVLSSCSTEETDNRLAAAVEQAIEEAVVPAIEAFSTEATDFETEADSFCASVDETSLRTLQDRWLSSMATWNRAGVYRIGPLYDDPIVPTIDLIESKRPRGTDYTATVRETIASAVEGATPLDDTYFRSLTFNRGGLLALEILVFEDGADLPSNAPADIVAAYEASPRRCEYLQGTAALLAERARGVATGWTESFGDAGTPFRHQFLEPTLPDGSEPAVALVTLAIEHVRYLHVRKLDGTADVQVAEAARPEVQPFFGNLEVAVLEIETMFTASSPNGPSLLDLMEERGFAEEAEALRAAIAQVLLWIRDAQEGGGNTSAAGAIRALAALDATLQNEVAAGLGITLPLNFNDGD
ncbi:MAG: imelysin family protein [Sandaracinaceae bacterium]